MRKTTQAILFVLGFPLVDYAQGSCLAKLAPLKPVSVMCSNAAPTCVCNSTGTDCGWLWGCPASSPSAATPTPQETTDPSIPLSYKSPQVNDPVETAIRLQMLREMRERAKGQGATPSSPYVVPAVPAAPTVSQDLGEYTDGLANGILWNGLYADEKLIWLSGVTETVKLLRSDDPATLVQRFPKVSVGEIRTIIDGVYLKPENLRIPIVVLFPWIDLKVKGASESALDAFLRKFR